MSLLVIALLGCRNALEWAVEEQERDAWCANVTDANWHSVTWGRSAHDQCVTLYPEMMLSNVEMHPCTLGGLAVFCGYRENGSMLIRFNNSFGTNLPAEDVKRIAPHLVIY